MTWQATLHTFPLVLVAAMLVASVVYLWLRKPMPGHRIVIWILLAGAEWLLAHVFELGSTQLLFKDFWNKMQYIGAVTSGTLWLIFTLEYTGRKWLLTWRTVTLLSLEPVVILVLVFTNELHGLVWARGVMNVATPFSRLIRPHSIVFWIHAVYYYGLLLLALALLIQMLVRSRHLYRRQVSLLLFATSLLLAGNVLMQLNPALEFDLIPLAMAVSSLVMVWSIFRLRLGDIVPVARDVVVEKLSDGVIVLDARGRIADLNPSARQIIGHREETVVGCPLRDILPELHRLIHLGHPIHQGDAFWSEEIALDRDGARYIYDVRVSPLLDWREQLTSQAIVLRDVTVRKKVTEEIAQWMLQLENLQEIGVGLASQLDLDTLLQAIALKAVELLDGEGGALALCDPTSDELEVVAAVGDITLAVGRRIYRGKGLLGQVWETGREILGDESPLSGKHAPGRSIAAERVGSVPVRWGDEFLGVLTVTRDSEYSPGFSPSDAKLLDLFASQAAAAILNARQYKEEREWATQMAVVNQVARKVASILELDHLLQEIVHAIHQGFGYPHVAILLRDDPGNYLGHLTIVGDYEGLITLDYQQRVGEGIIGYAAQTGETVLVNDVSRDPRYIIGFDDLVPTQSELSIPIQLADDVIGVLDVQDRRLNAFDQMDKMALETLADQIAVAIDNAQLYAAAQSQAERLAVVNRIARAAGSTLHPDELLETVHYEISTVLDADVFFIATYEEADDSLVFRFLVGDDTSPPPFRRPLGEGWTSYVVTHKAPLLVRDYDRERYQLPKPEVWGSDVVATSWLGVPMLIGERVIGVVCLQSYRPEVYGEEELLLLSTVADQVAVAVENAQLFQAERAQREQAELLAETVTAISSTLDVDRVLINILEGARYLLNVTAGSIWLLDDESGELVCEQATGPQSDIVRSWRLPPGQGIAGWVACHGQSLIVSDTQDDARYFQDVDLQTGVPLRSILSTPIQLHDEVIGVLQVADKATDRFYALERTLVESLASAAAIAIENARLYGQAQQDALTKSALLREVNHRVKNNLAAIIGLLYAERRRADEEDLEVYDVIMQDMANRIQGLATVHSLLSAAEWSNLPLSELTQQIIHSALEMLPHGKRVSVDVCSSSVWVTPDQAHNLALVINEMATNTIKYGLKGRDRGQISVQIEEHGDLVTFEFRDDGPGFPEEVLRAEQFSVGFDLIRSIVQENLSGDISLCSRDGAVTTIQFRAGT